MWHLSQLFSPSGIKHSAGTIMPVLTQMVCSTLQPTQVFSLRSDQACSISRLRGLALQVYLHLDEASHKKLKRMTDNLDEFKGMVQGMQQNAGGDMLAGTCVAGFL
jgi:hypothetical protein